MLCWFLPYNKENSVINKYIHMCVFSVVSDSAIPWTIACQAPLSVEFSRQEYWSGLPFPSPGHHPNSEIYPQSPVSVEEPPGKPLSNKCCSVAQSCPTLCNPTDCSIPGFPVLHYLLEFAQIHVH